MAKAAIRVPKIRFPSQGGDRDGEPEGRGNKSAAVARAGIARASHI